MYLGWRVGKAHLQSIFRSMNVYIFVVIEGKKKKKLLQQIRASPPSSGIAHVYRLPSSWDVHESFVWSFLKSDFFIIIITF